MKYHNQFFFYAKLLLMLIFFSGWQISQAAEGIDYSQLKKNLNIMSVILDKIMNPDNDRFLGESNTRAVYLEGHGVLFIFHEKLTLSHIIISNSDDKSLDKYYQFESSSPTWQPATTQQKNDLQRDKNYRYSKQIEVTARTQAQDRRETRTKLVEFLGDYCGAMKQLVPSDQVTVIVLSGNSKIFRMDESLTFQREPESTQLVASVSFEDILAYRRESVNQENFIKRIQINDEAADAQVDQDLEIMRNILGVTLQQKNDSELVLDKNISGIYLQKFGALFVLNFDRNFRTKMLQVQADYENLLSIINEEEEHFVKKGKAIADELKQEVIDVLADYGHNLKRLKDDEWIGVAVDLNPIPGKDAGPASLFFKVQKKDATAVNHGKINRNEFKKRVEVTSY